MNLHDLFMYKAQIHSMSVVLQLHGDPLTPIFEFLNQMPLNSMLKNGYDDKFCYVYFITSKNN